MKRWIAWLLMGMLLLGVLAGCQPGKSRTPGIGATGQSQQDEGTQAGRRFTLLLPRSLDPILLQAARSFAQRLDELSDGQLTAALQYSDDLEQDFQAGNGELAFFDTATVVSRCPSWGMINSAFCFKDQLHMEMALNTPSMKDYLQPELTERLGAQNLAVLYNSSSVLVTSDESMRSVEAFQGLRIGIRYDTTMQTALETLGALPEQMDQQDRMEQLVSGEIPMIECRIYDLPQLEEQMRQQGRPVVVLPTYHLQEPVWFLMRSDVYDGLSWEQREQLEEANAYLIATVNQEMKEHEEGILDGLVQDDYFISPVELSNIKRRARIGVLEARENGSYGWDLSLYDRLQSMSG